jgi:hypothetical protein
MTAFEEERSMLWREVGRRIMAGVLNHVEPVNNAEALSCLWFSLDGQVTRLAIIDKEDRQHMSTVQHA